MGKRLIALAAEAPNDFSVVAAIERAGHVDIGRDAGEAAGSIRLNVPIATELAAKPDVLIDFTVPAALRQWLEVCRKQKIAMVIGTTGLRDEDHAAIDKAARDIAILQASNMSLGVNVLLRVAAQVAAALGEDYDIEIVELHHRFKKDAPSGTALSLADSILKATGRTRDALVHGRHGDDVVRKPGQIGMHALRIGDEVGKHTISYGNLGERVELTHTATNRDTFVRGALRAAKWLAGRKPGRYTMAEVLGL